MTNPVRDLGACPVCGDLVPRHLALREGRPAETYECSLHGPLVYGAGALPLQQWADQAAGPAPDMGLRSV